MRYEKKEKWILKPEPDVETVSWINGGAKEVSKVIEPIIVEVNEGETLYLPAAWFHEVLQAIFQTDFRIGYFFNQIF